MSLTLHNVNNTCSGPVIGEEGLGHSHGGLNPHRSRQIFGTSTAYHLALSHKDASLVTIIDQAPPPPTQAAAVDVNRIIRVEYPSTLYCNLANEAIHAWFWQIEL